ncbi:hypothetical protein HJFPF1_12299 [Paramyrothecium foliicola]|nr:hypothetical protein HJFPF1_12299 [Paramyrothecium foliicola]
MVDQNPQDSRYKRRNGSKHDKTGCLTCRQRRKKCVTNTFPVCGECIRLNLRCVREPIRDVLPPRKAGGTATSLTLQEWSQQPPSLFWLPYSPPSLQQDSQYDGIDTIGRRHALSYYITVLAQMLTVCERHNSFISAFMPMAMDSPALSDALVAWATGHMSTFDPKYRVTALQAYGAAVRNLCQAVSASNDLHSAEANAATCLSLVTSEVCLGESSSWLRHLAGARDIIISAGSQNTSGSRMPGGIEAFRKSSEGQWILRNFAYHDILASVTLGAKPLIQAKYLDGITEVVDTYLGVATPILGYISDISSRDWNFTHSLAEQESFYHAARGCIMDWHCPEIATPALAAVAYAYQSAALIYLCRKMRAYLEEYGSAAQVSDVEPKIAKSSAVQAFDEQLQFEVANIVENVSHIPISEHPESPILFPLFLAGGEARDPLHIAIIRTRLHLTYEKRHFRNIKHALDVLELVWSQRETGYDSYYADWENILRSKEAHLLLC